jgi:hypothetical protein
MEFEENNKEFEGNMTRKLKEKHREFFTRVGQVSKISRKSPRIGRNDSR